APPQHAGSRGAPRLRRGVPRAWGAWGAISGPPTYIDRDGRVWSNERPLLTREQEPWRAMEAVIATGGKQYLVAPGQVIKIEKLEGDKGAAVAFTSVLMVSRDGEVIVGPDRLKSAKVSGEVLAQGRGRKVEIVKFKRRKNYRRHRGHRQSATTVRITTIEV